MKDLAQTQQFQGKVDGLIDHPAPEASADWVNSARETGIG